MSALLIFAATVAVLGASGRSEILTDRAAAAVFLVMVFLPALLIARWQLHKPPQAAEQPDQ
jgi:hypothetical protein